MEKRLYLKNEFLNAGRTGKVVRNSGDKQPHSASALSYN